MAGGREQPIRIAVFFSMCDNHPPLQTPTNNFQMDACLNNHLGVFKNRGWAPKMDGENNGNAYFELDDLG